MKIKTFIISAVIGLTAISCARENAIEKDSPEAITGLFIEALAAGDCDEALKLSSSDANETVLATKDAGCEGYKSEIGITCDSIIDNKTSCICIERQNGGMASAYKYDLEKIDGKWKVTAFDKDMGDMMGDPNAGGMEMPDLESMDAPSEEIIEDGANTIEEGENKLEEVIETVSEMDIK